MERRGGRSPLWSGVTSVRRFVAGEAARRPLAAVVRRNVRKAVCREVKRGGPLLRSLAAVFGSKNVLTLFSVFQCVSLPMLKNYVFKHKKVVKMFGGLGKSVYLCTRFREGTPGQEKIEKKVAEKFGQSKNST